MTVATLISPLAESFFPELLHDFERHSNAFQDPPLIFMAISQDLFAQIWAVHCPEDCGCDVAENEGSLWCWNEEFDEDLMKWWLIQCFSSEKRPTTSFTCCLLHSLFLFTLSSISLFSLTHFLSLPPSLSRYSLLWDFSSSFRSYMARCIIVPSGFSWVPQRIFVWIWHRNVSSRVRLTHMSHRGQAGCVYVRAKVETHVYTHSWHAIQSWVERQVGWALWPFNPKLKHRSNRKHVWFLL